MKRKIHDFPCVLTSFAYRQEYWPELDGMLNTVRHHHPDWTIIVGRGPCEDATFEVEHTTGREKVILPVDLNLDGSANDYRKITHVKAWWTSYVWNQWTGDGIRRLLWLDADARLNGSLDFEVDQDAEVLAGVWWSSNKKDFPELDNYETITSGLLFFQGQGSGPASRVLDLWREASLAEICCLRPPTVRWLDGDQETLTEVLLDYMRYGSSLQLLRLEGGRYSGDVRHDGTRQPGALVDQWMMSRRMKYPETRNINWPPPEAFRR